MRDRLTGTEQRIKRRYSRRAFRGVGLVCEVGNGGDEAVDFFGGGVAGAAGADEAFGGEAEAVDDRGGVEVAVGEEQSAVGELAGDFGGGDAVDGEGNGRGARGVGGW